MKQRAKKKQGFLCMKLLESISSSSLRASYLSSSPIIVLATIAFTVASIERCVLYAQGVPIMARALCLHLPELGVTRRTFDLRCFNSNSS